MAFFSIFANGWARPRTLMCVVAWLSIVSHSVVAYADPLSIVWRSKATSTDSLALDFGALYGALSRLYSLGIQFPTKQVSSAGRPLEKVLQDEHQYVGAFLAPDAERLVCQLSEKACSISAQTGAPKWTGSNDVVTIPAFDFRPLWTPQYYSAKKGDTIEAIVVRDRHGCETIDLKCKELIRSLNPAKADILENPSGKIVVPSLNYFAEIKFDGVNLPAPNDDDGELLKELDVLRSSSDNSATKQRAEAVFSAVKPVIPNIVTVSGAKPNAATNAPSSPASAAPSTPAYEAALKRRQAIFNLIGAGGWDPSKGGPYLKVNVALIDSRVDDKHCDFYPGQVHLSITPPHGAKEEDGGIRGECDLILVPIPSVTTHGTHVAGIIGAKVGSRIGPGLFPFTNLFSYELDLSNAKAFMPAVGALLEQILSDQIKVLNISGMYVKPLGPGSDPFDEVIIRGPGPIKDQMLIVAAAGNDGQQIGSDALDCPPRPACYNINKNVISVIAVDDDLMAPSPAIFNEKEASNRGEHFDIAAPGLKVPSTAPMNQVAELGGTSQATPIVSGAAAHLYALRPAAHPGEIKNRLIWTSDLLPSLYKKALGGRINLSAALNDLDSDVLRLHNGSTAKGNISQKDNYTLHVRVKETDKSVDISLAKVRRLLKIENDSWDLMWLDMVPDDGPLSRKKVIIESVTYRDDYKHKEYDRDTFSLSSRDKAVSVSLSSDLEDYISNMPNVN